MPDLQTLLVSEDEARIRRELTGRDLVDEDGRRPLAMAARWGALDLVELLLDIGEPIDGRNADDLGYTALGTAVQDSQAAVVRLLLARGADVDAGDSIGGTPLHHAAVGGQADLARLLLAAGAAVDAVDDLGASPLLRVAVHADAVHLSLLEHFDPQPRAHPLHDEHLQVAGLLLDAGADPDRIAASGYSALHHAAENGALALAERLLAAGARAHLPNGKGYTALHAAGDSRAAGLPLVQLLLRAGAEPNAEDAYGFVALHGAAQRGAAPIVAALLAAGADPSRRTRDAYDRVTAGMTPADAADAYGHADVAALLR